MFKKSCVAVAVGMALMQWAPAWAEAPSEDFIVVDQPISLNDVTKPQDSTVNYDKNVLYQTGLGLNGQGGTKNLVVNVKDGKGQFGERQKFCVHGIIGARQTGASNEHEHQTQFS